VVYSSPLLRARETAEEIAGLHGLTVQVVDDLIEVDVGNWEGRSWDEIQQTDPETYQRFMTDAGVHPYLGGENLGTIQARVVPAFGRLLAENLGRVIVAVAHNVVNRSYLAHLLDVPLAKYRLVPQDNCGVSLLRYRDDRVKLVTINAVSHLKQDVCGGVS
jgi:broad specificity phosphatase PhoE